MSFTDWVSYYLEESPYSCERHELKSYSLTYTDLAKLLEEEKVGYKSKIIDVGAGTGKQFDLVNDLNNWSWILIEPADQIHHGNVFKHSCVTQLEKSLTDLPSYEDVSCITICSVTQYMKDDELFEILSYAVEKFSNLNLIILSDVSLENSAKGFDVIVYLMNSIRYGWFLVGLFKLHRLATGEYKNLRKKIPLRVYSIAELKRFADTKSFKLKMKNKNIGYNFHRKTLVFNRYASNK